MNFKKYIYVPVIIASMALLSVASVARGVRLESTPKVLAAQSNDASITISPVNPTATVSAGSVAYTNAQRFEAIQKDLSNLGASYGINISVSPIREQLPYITWSLVNESDIANLETMTHLLKGELTKYPKDFIKKSRLKNIFLVKKLQVSNVQYRAAIPDPVFDSAVYYDISEDNLTYDNGQYMRNVIHHEFNHLVESNIFGSYSWDDKAWRACNDTAFTYARGGYLAYTDSSYANTKHPFNGFVTGYATFGIDEDKAEVFAALMTNYDGLKVMAKTDAQLQCKIDIYQRYLQSISPEFTATYLDERS